MVEKQLYAIASIMVEQEVSGYHLEALGKEGKPTGNFKQGRKASAHRHGKMQPPS